MKRNQLIEAGILIVGIIFGFKFFDGIVVIIMQLIANLQFNGGMDYLLPSLFMIIVYAVVFIILIRNSGRIANYLGSFAENSNFSLKVKKGTMLQVIIIALGLITIIQNLAEILIYLYEAFKGEVGGNGFLEDNIRTINKEKFTIDAVQTIIAFIIIYFSKNISGWFLDTDSVDELTLDSEEPKN